MANPNEASALWFIEKHLLDEVSPMAMNQWTINESTSTESPTIFGASLSSAPIVFSEPEIIDLPTLRFMDLISSPFEFDSDVNVFDFDFKPTYQVLGVVCAKPAQRTSHRLDHKYIY